MDKPVPDGGIHSTLFDGIGSAVRSRMVQDFVHVTAQQFIHLVSQHAGTARVHEGRVSTYIDAVDPFSGLVQNECVLALELFECESGLLAFGDIANDAAIVAAGS